ncbi:MAG: hypothetical protein VYB37_02520 [Pseudomonadota bacterium]|nr:hypothetical protein [Pseudomonadota bacterium]
MNAQIGILALWNDCAPGHEELYDKWYHGEHFLDRVSVKGFRMGRRHESLGGHPRFFTYYETESAAVLFSAAYQAQLDQPSPLTQEVMAGVFINVTRTVCACVQRSGRERGGFVVTMSTRAHGKEEGLKTTALLFGDVPGVVRTEVWVRVIDSGQAYTGPRQEEQIRGQDKTIASCLVLHLTREDSARSVVDQLMTETDADWDIDVYRLLSELRHEDCR